MNGFQRVCLVEKMVEKKFERIAPKIIKNAIEEVYKTPFSLLEQYRRKNIDSSSRKLIEC